MAPGSSTSTSPEQQNYTQSGDAINPSGNVRPNSRKRPKTISGAASKRRKWWISRGKSLEEASILCRKPFSELTEYPEVRDWLTKVGNSQPVKRHSEDDSEDQPRKLAKIDEEDIPKPSVRVVGTSKVGIQDKTRLMNTTEIQQLQKAILNCISTSSKGEGPRFLGNSVREGCLVLTCYDEQTRDWVAAQVPNLKPYKGANLRLVDERDLPKAYYGTAQIPDPKLDAKTILHRLQAQNTDGMIDHWRIIKTKVEETSQIVTFAFDKSALEALQKRSFRLFFGFSGIHIRVKNPLKKLGNETREVTAAEAVPGMTGAWSVDGELNETQPDTALASDYERNRRLGRWITPDSDEDEVDEDRNSPSLTYHHPTYEQKEQSTREWKRPCLLPTPPCPAESYQYFSTRGNISYPPGAYESTRDHICSPQGAYKDSRDNMSSPQGAYEDTQENMSSPQRAYEDTRDNISSWGVYEDILDNMSSPQGAYEGTQDNKSPRRGAYEDKTGTSDYKRGVGDQTRRRDNKSRLRNNTHSKKPTNPTMTQNTHKNSKTLLYTRHYSYTNTLLSPSPFP